MYISKYWHYRAPEKNTERHVSTTLGVPALLELSIFQGRVFHQHVYRTPKGFLENKKRFLVKNPSEGFYRKPFLQL
jgi:hypothetical protein